MMTPFGRKCYAIVIVTTAAWLLMALVLTIRFILEAA